MRSSSASGGSRRGSGGKGKRFDPTAYVRDKNEREEKAMARRGRSESPVNVPKVRRVVKAREGNVKKSPRSKAPVRGATVGGITVGDQGVMRDINEIDRRLNALQGFLKDAKSPGRNK